MKSGGEPERSQLSSLVVEALEEAALTFNAIRDLLRRAPLSDAGAATASTSLDVLLRKARLTSLERLYAAFAAAIIETHGLDELDEAATTRLSEFAAQFCSLAVDPQLSIPDVVVHMLVEGRVVGFARLPAAELYYAPASTLRRGLACGQLRATPLNWPSAAASKFRVSFWFVCVSNYDLFESL